MKKEKRKWFDIYVPNSVPVLSGDNLPLEEEGEPQRKFIPTVYFLTAELSKTLPGVFDRVDPSEKEIIQKYATFLGMEALEAKNKNLKWVFEFHDEHYFKTDNKPLYEKIEDNLGFKPQMVLRFPSDRLSDKKKKEAIEEIIFYIARRTAFYSTIDMITPNIEIPFGGFNPNTGEVLLENQVEFKSEEIKALDTIFKKLETVNIHTHYTKLYNHIHGVHY
jgi:hypothetical protein